MKIDDISTSIKKNIFMEPSRGLLGKNMFIAVATNKSLMFDGAGCTRHDDAQASYSIDIRK